MELNLAKEYAKMTFLKCYLLVIIATEGLESEGECGMECSLQGEQLQSDSGT